MTLDHDLATVIVAAIGAAATSTVAVVRHLAAKADAASAELLAEVRADRDAAEAELRRLRGTADAAAKP